MKTNKLSRKDIIKCTAVVLAAVLVISLMIALVYIFDNRDNGDDEQEMPGEYLSYNGKRYYLRNDVETILVMGLDKYEEKMDDTVFDSGNRNMQCADFMLLLVFDHGNKTCSAIHINRDTMADITYVNKNNGTKQTVTSQITLAHTYGAGGAESATNAANAVSNLLCGIPIDYYATFTMDAIYAANDFVGGVTVEVLDDLTPYDPALKKGEIVTLNAKQAEHYVRHRWDLENSTNLSRMARQRQYLTALYEKVMNVSSDNESFSADAVLELEKYMFTNCTANKLDYFFDRAEEYEMKDIHTYSGEQTHNEKRNVEYWANQNDIKRIVTTLLYKTK